MTFKDNIEIELAIFDTNEEAIAFFDVVKKDAQDNKSQDDVVKEESKEDNYAMYNVKSEKEYLAVSKFNKTVLYVSTISDKQKEVDKIFKKFGY